MILREGISLYHGSYVHIPQPELRKCRPGKDFGRGFYLTTSREQAVKFVRISVRNAIREGKVENSRDFGILNRYHYWGSTEQLKVFEFRETDARWLHCVAGYRKKGSFPEEINFWQQYDILVGKIADDQTNLVITTYIDGLYGAVGSRRADEIAIGFLEPERLQNQICLRTEKAIKTIRFEKYETIRI